MRIRMIVVALIVGCFFSFYPVVTYANLQIPSNTLPEAEVSRLTFAVGTAKVLGVQPLFPEVATFTDLTAGTVEAGYVEALAKLGIINGRETGLFGGADPIQRQDVAVVLKKALGGQALGVSKLGTYKDVGQVWPYARDGVDYVTTKGWMIGDKGYFYPSRNLKEAEAFVLLNRLLKVRSEQAAQALEKPNESLRLGLGETRELGFVSPSAKYGFSTSLGLDNPVVCDISSEGREISGKQVGSGLLTANGGSQFFPVKLEVKDTTGADGRAIQGSSVAGQERVMEVTYRVESKVPDTSFNSIEVNSYPGPIGGPLSPGKEWTGFLRQQGRDVIVDLGKVTSVSSLSLEFLQNSQAAVFIPEYIEGAVSSDGVNWFSLGRAYQGTDPSDEEVKTASLSIAFPSLNARYLRLSFPVEVWVLARHLTVKGGLPADEPIILAPVTPEADQGSYLLDPKYRDILLVYTGDKTDQQTFSTTDFLPLAAYLTPNGKVKGNMFDTMLFIPYTRLPCTREAWLAYLDDLFASGKQLQALDQAMLRLSKATGTQKIEKVILSLPYPDEEQLAFDTSLSFSSAQKGKEKAAINRLEAVQWFYGELMNRWKAAGFTHLQLAGTYWNQESINFSNYGELEMVQEVAYRVKENKQDFFWIPYYGAAGYQDWKELGFTHVFLQPNYYATQPAGEDRMTGAALLARKNGTGIELEMDNRIISSSFYKTLFYKEMEQAQRLGMDANSVIAYHVGIKGTLLDTVSSAFPEVRKIYDDLYTWINGTYLKPTKNPKLP